MRSADTAKRILFSLFVSMKEKESMNDREVFPSERALERLKNAGGALLFRAKAVPTSYIRFTNSEHPHAQ